VNNAGVPGGLVNGENVLRKVRLIPSMSLQIHVKPLHWWVENYSFEKWLYMFLVFKF